MANIEWYRSYLPWLPMGMPRMNLDALTADSAKKLLGQVVGRSPTLVREILSRGILRAADITPALLIEAAWIDKCLAQLLAAAPPAVRAACWAPGGWGPQAMAACEQPVHALRHHFQFAGRTANMLPHAGPRLFKTLMASSKAQFHNAVGRMTPEARGLTLTYVISRVSGRFTRDRLADKILAAGRVRVSDVTMRRAAALGAGGVQLFRRLLTARDMTLGHMSVLRWAMHADNMPLLRASLAAGPSPATVAEVLPLAFNARTPRTFWAIHEHSPEGVARGACDALVCACRAGWPDVLAVLRAHLPGMSLDTLREIVDPAFCGNAKRSDDRYWRRSPRKKPLSLAVRLELLLAARVDEVEEAWRLLDEAVACANDDGARILIQAGVRVTTRAVNAGIGSPLAEALIAAADEHALSSRGPSGLTPLRTAIREGSFADAMALSRRGLAATREECVELVRTATQRTDAARLALEIADSFRSAGVNTGTTRPLTLAVRGGAVEVAEALLLRAGALVFAEDLEAAKTARMREVLQHAWRKELALGWARLSHRGVAAPDATVELCRRLPRQALRVVIDFVAPLQSRRAGRAGAAGVSRASGRRKGGKNARRRRR